MNPNLYGLQIIDGFSLRPCPFCGGTAAIVKLPENFDEECNFYSGVCTVCSMAGKPFILPVSAANFWNDRVSNLKK